MQSSKYSHTELDRRRYPRSEPTTPFKLDLRAKDVALAAKVRNLSCNGAYCHVTKPIAEMTRVMMVLETDAYRIKCNGTVVRAEPVAEKGGYDIAVFFDRISKSDQEKLVRLLGN